MTQGRRVVTSFDLERLREIYSAHVELAECVAGLDAMGEDSSELRAQLEANHPAAAFALRLIRRAESERGGEGASGADTPPAANLPGVGS